MPDKIVMLDGYSLMYRAFHALQTPMTAPDGTPTNAVHGFVMMLLKVLDEEKPAGIAVAFDMHAPTFRAQEYAAYKGTRKPMPDELRAQDPVIRELIGLMGIPILEKEGYEADDILGTVSAMCEREGREIVLVTGDRDSFQLSGEKTTILYTRRGISDTVRVTPEYIRGHAIRGSARRGHQGQPNHRAGGRYRNASRGHVRAHRGADSRKIRRRRGNSEQQGRNGTPARRSGIRGGVQERVEARGRPRQGQFGPLYRGRYRENAARADRRPDRFR